MDRRTSLIQRKDASVNAGYIQADARSSLMLGPRSECGPSWSWSRGSGEALGAMGLTDDGLLRCLPGVDLLEGGNDVVCPPSTSSAAADYGIRLAKSSLWCSSPSWSCPALLVCSGCWSATCCSEAACRPSYSAAACPTAAGESLRRRSHNALVKGTASSLDGASSSFFNSRSVSASRSPRISA